MTVTISLAELNDTMEAFLGRRAIVPPVAGSDGEYRLAAEEANVKLVAWFAERDITLVVDRDIVAHEQFLYDSFDVDAFIAEKGIPVVNAEMTETSPESVGGLPTPNAFTDAEMGMAARQFRQWGKSDEEIAEVLNGDLVDLKRWDAAVVQHGGITQSGIVRGPEYTDYTLEVTLGNQRHSFMLSQRYASEDMAKRDYTAAASVKRLALVRHTGDTSEILRSWEPS